MKNLKAHTFWSLLQLSCYIYIYNIQILGNVATETLNEDKFLLEPSATQKNKELKTTTETETETETTTEFTDSDRDVLVQQVDGPWLTSAVIVPKMIVLLPFLLMIVFLLIGINRPKKKQSSPQSQQSSSDTAVVNIDDQETQPCLRANSGSTAMLSQ